MAKKKVYGITSDIRYTMKMAQLLSSKSPDPELAKNVAILMNSSRASGFAPYHGDWNLIKQQLRIPPLVCGMYRAFFNELIKQVKIRGVIDLEDLITKYRKMSGGAFDEELGRAIARAVGIPTEKEPATQTKT